jgi:biotin carboxyl carrier protein
MRFEIEINGQVRVVSVETPGAAGPDGGHFRLLIDGETHEVDARRTDLGLSIVAQDGTSIDAAVTDRGGGKWFVQLPRVAVSAVVDGRRFRRADVGDDGGTGAQRVTAPMPGRIVRVLVGEGDEVDARQGLVVVEAMKMENELTVSRAGRVREVAVSEGDLVEAGRLLVIVE